MPKMKTSRAAAKRFRVTGTGNVRRRKQGKGHMLTAKTRKRKRNLRQSALVSPQDVKRVKRILGIG
jgi:large subunit ribosomal protein L35